MATMAFLPDPATTLLRQLCQIEIDPDRIQEIKILVSGITDWSAFIQLAESHGLSNLAHYHLSDLDIELPEILRPQFLSLKARHRRANAARHRALEEILKLFSQHNINAVVLKGAALVHLLYQAPELRPMSDIDILVERTQAENAQQCLRDLGYHAANHQTGFMSDHHHLPIATKTDRGIVLQVEIHHDALSGDVQDSICLDSTREPFQSFMVGDQIGYALGPTDMLRHLCHHTFEPVERIKLGAVADLYGCACAKLDQIDQQKVVAEYSFVVNILTLLHYLSPLPEKLQKWISPPTAPPPAGVGKGYAPMSKTMAKFSNPFSRLTHLIQAPDWWLHGFYNVSPEKSLFLTKWFRHPIQVLKWILRRINARSKGS